MTNGARKISKKPSAISKLQSPRRVASTTVCSCGVPWIHHPSIIETCEKLREAQEQLILYRWLMFYLKLRFIPEHKEFTDSNLVEELDRIHDNL